MLTSTCWAENWHQLQLPSEVFVTSCTKSSLYFNSVNSTCTRRNASWKKNGGLSCLLNLAEKCHQLQQLRVTENSPKSIPGGWKETLKTSQFLTHYFYRTFQTHEAHKRLRVSFQSNQEITENTPSSRNERNHKKSKNKSTKFHKTSAEPRSSIGSSTGQTE